MQIKRMSLVLTLSRFVPKRLFFSSSLFALHSEKVRLSNKEELD